MLSNPLDFHIMLAAVISIMLAGDLYRRSKNAHKGLEGSADWSGLLPYAVLACLGGLSVFIVGWLGWTLLTLGAIASSDRIKVSGNSGSSPIETAIVLRLLLVSEIAVEGSALLSLLRLTLERMR